jgi:hypothetical protein
MAFSYRARSRRAAMASSDGIPIADEVDREKRTTPRTGYETQGAGVTEAFGMLQHSPPGYCARSAVAPSRALCDLQIEGRAHESTRVILLRIAKNFVGGALLYHATVVHHEHVMGKRPHHA